MSIVTVKLSNKNFQLYCNSGEEETILSLAAKLDSKINEIKHTNPIASFELLLVMVALNTQAEISTLTAKSENILQKNLQDEEKFSETLIAVTGYLENLARKMEN